MWREARLALTDSVTALNCSMVPVHPWIYGLGQHTDNGAYLSPVNATAYLARKLAGTGGEADVVILMVASQTHDSFMSSLNQLTEVFPAPAFVQVKRLAHSAATLATEKMQLPAGMSAALPPSVPLSVPSSRAAFAAAVVKQAQSEAGAAAGLDGLKAQLAAFGQKRDAMLADIAAGLGDLQGKSARAWVFTGSGDVVTTLTQLVKDIPQPSAVHTAAVMLVGDNLEGIRGMIHEYKPDAGA